MWCAHTVGETNRPDAQCFKCNFVMSFEAYHKGVEEKERKDKELQALRNEILEIKAAQRKKEDEMQEQIEEIRDSYQGLNKTLNEVVDLRRKIRANPEGFLEDDAAKLIKR